MQTWLQKRLKVLSESFNDKEFTMEDTVKVLSSKFKDKESKILVMFSKLKDEGKIEAKLDPKDSRRRIYRIIDGASSLQTKGDLNQAELHSLLKEAADLIRTRVDYTFILLLLFFKRMSDKWTADYESAVQKVMKEYSLSREEALKEAEHDVYHDFSISHEFLWDNIRRDPAKLAENFSKAMKHIAERNPQLRDIFENFDFLQFAGNRENQEILRQLVELFSSHSLQTVAPDMLGDAYEWTLRYFAPQKAKEGEVYTAREVIKLIVEYLDPKPGETVYDPACGSGGMLIISHQHAKEKYGDEAAKKMLLFGQEVNFRTRALAKMNLYLHSIANGVIEYGDAILYPKFKDGDSFKRFDVVIANPPWNQNGYDEQTVKRGDFVKERFSFGYGPDQSADWLWIQHMLASADHQKGRVGVIIDSGALLRGGKEKSLRRTIIENDKIEAIILLPEKLFYNTPSQGVVIILRNEKLLGDQGSVLFINAAKLYEKHPDVRRLNRLEDLHIGSILSARGSTNIVGLSRRVEKKEIVGNGYNLNVSLYVRQHDVREIISIQNEWKTIKGIQSDMIRMTQRVEHYLSELSYIDGQRQIKKGKFKETEIGSLPFDWDVVKIDEITDVITGSTPSTKERSYWKDGTINWLTPTDLSNLEKDIYVNESQRKITTAALDRNNLTLLPVGSIILSTRAPVGYVAVTTQPTTFNQGCKALIPLGGTDFVPEFYAYYLRLVRDRLEALSGGSTFKELSKDSLKSLLVPHPSKKEQEFLSKILLDIHEKLRLEQQGSDRLSRLMEALRYDLVGGKVRHPEFI